MQLRDLNANITKNFKYGEFVRSETAMKYGIKIEPTEQQWRNIENLCRNILQPVANRFGSIRINSGIRTPELTVACRDINLYLNLKRNNPAELQRVIANTHSYHDDGMAADIEPVGNTTLTELLEYIATKLPYSQLIAEYFPTGWVHVAYWQGENGRPKGLLLLKDKNHNYARVTIDYIKNLYR